MKYLSEQQPGMTGRSSGVTQVVLLHHHHVSAQLALRYRWFRKTEGVGIRSRFRSQRQTCTYSNRSRLFPSVIAVLLSHRDLQPAA